MKEQLTNQILKILYKNSKVCFKGIGELRLIYQRTSIDLENRWLLPPEIWFSFTPDRECPMDEMLIKSYSRVWNSSLDSMFEFLESEMAVLRQQLNKDGSCRIKALGTFYKRMEGNIYFLPDQKNPLRYVFFGLPRLTLPSESVAIQESEQEREPAETPGSTKTQIISLQSRTSKTGNVGPLIAGIFVLILTATVLYWAGVRKNAQARPQSVALEQPLDRKINISPSLENSDPEDMNDPALSAEDGEALVHEHMETKEDVTLLPQCIVIVGAFGQRSNVDQMVYRIVQQTSFKPVVVEGSLIKVGFAFDCDGESWKETLQWARDTFNEDAWLYKN